MLDSHSKRKVLYSEMEKELESSTKNRNPPLSLPTRVEDTSMIDRLDSSVRSFLLRAASRVNSFYTIIEKNCEKVAEDNRWWLDFDEDNNAKNKYTEKNYVAVPSIVFSNSENPGHKHHLKCLASPPLERHEEDKLMFENDVLLKMTE